MASPSGGKGLNGHKLENAYQSGEHSNPELISDGYEELFENEGGERPCYLPDSGQEDDGSPELENAEDRVDSHDRSGTIVNDRDVGREYHTTPVSEGHVNNASSEVNAIASETSVQKSQNGSRSSTNDESVEDEEEADRMGTDSSLEDRSGLSDRDPSSVRGFGGPSSPGSSQGGTSGYVAGSGSSSGSSLSRAPGPPEIVPHGGAEENGTRKEDKIWEPGKRSPHEDDTYPSWRQHKKHFFILSNAGKPVYSRYGDENKLAGFSATLQAIISFVENSGDTIHLVRAGDHQILFLVKGPLYLVCISSTDEPYLMLKNQLELLHGQLLLILTKSVEKCFAKNAKFDMRPLLGGTEVVFSSLIHGFSWNPASFIHAYTCLPLPYAARQAAVVALQDMTETEATFALLMCGPKVIGIVGPRRDSLHPDDILLLSNFISSSDSFRTSESFSPVCLPRYNTSAFMYAYVQYLDKDACLILLTGDSGNFFHLKECRAQLEVILRDSDVLREVNNSVLRGGLRVEDLPEEISSSDSKEQKTSSTPDDHKYLTSGVGGAAGLWHFVYRSTYLNQYVASEFSPPLHTRVAQKRLLRAYQKLHSSMHEDGAAGPHKMQYRRDNNHVLLSWRTTDFELYAAFDPLAEKSGAITVCNRICQWLRELESEIFLLGTTSFSWMNCILSLCSR